MKPLLTHIPWTKFLIQLRIIQLSSNLLLFLFVLKIYVTYWLEEAYNKTISPNNHDVEFSFILLLRIPVLFTRIALFTICLWQGGNACLFECSSINSFCLLNERAEGIDDTHTLFFIILRIYLAHIFTINFLKLTYLWLKTFGLNSLSLVCCVFLIKRTFYWLDGNVHWLFFVSLVIYRIVLMQSSNCIVAITDFSNFFIDFCCTLN